MTAPVKCAKGQRILSGGFDNPDFADLGGPEVLPFVSRKQAGRKWTASAYNEGNEINRRGWGEKALRFAPVSESLQPPFGTREERIAYNEAWSRTINEKGAAWKLGREPMPEFRCECWKKGCEQSISLSGEDWKLARAQPNRFAVAPGHVAEDFEAVVTSFPHFWLIEKFGEAGEIAEKLASSDRGQASPP